jgi:NADH dehydrogenase
MGHLMQRPVLVTGAAGFVGSHVCRLASQAGIPFRAFDLRDDGLKRAKALGGEVSRGDITSLEHVMEAVKGVRAVLHLITAHEHLPREAHERITLGGVRNLVRACGEHGVRRVLFVSSIKAGRDYAGIYGATKRKAEQMLAQADLDLTIFRPALLYGPGETRLRRIATMMRRWRVVPVIGDGSYRMHPIFVGDLVAAMLRAIDSVATFGQTYEMGGPEALTYDEILDCLMERLRIKALKIHVPLGVCEIIARAVQAASRHPIIFVDQVLAQRAPVRCDIGPAQRDLGFEPLEFRKGLARYDPT